MSFLELKNSIFKALIEIFVFDKKKRTKLKSRWAKKHLKKYVERAISMLDSSDNTVSPKDESREIIWQYWQQGTENAPILMQKCLESTKRYHPDKKIIVLNLDNVKDYVEIPSKYYDMLNQGKMRPAFFSDILRTYLLCKYGGTWVDSTIYFTGRIPDEIFESDFFVFSKSPEEDPLENNMSNFFIHSKPNSKTMNAIKIALNEYWRENDFVINYFFYEHIASMLSKYSVLKEDWENMPKYSMLDTVKLYPALYADFSEERFEEIKSISNIHKLSHKIIRESSSGKSFYDKIIGGDI